MTSPSRSQGLAAHRKAPARWVCVHGHFYQPPRENPWLEEIELQPSASPFHDWNERITAECYRPNTAARILDEKGRIKDIVSNYAHISFNMGPTLLSWLEGHDPETYTAVLQADRDSRKRFGGHGSAMAQAYNHAILPLMSARDRQTQVVWGIRDFEKRFGRKPEGMWLPETAADVPTLEALAEQGIAFTVLAPHQVRRQRPIGATTWETLPAGGIDPSRAYRAALPSGRSLALFIYDGAISQAVAFEKLLSDGGRFAARLESAFVATRPWSQLVSIATDGETFGHHHAFGDMALAWALRHFVEARDVSLTNYGQFLARQPPTYEVDIVAPSAWSCAHGVERWRSDCGCQAGAQAGWNQAWRTPLRKALDNLRDSVAPLFEQSAARYLKDPWAARNDYVDVILDRSDRTLERYLGAHAKQALTHDERRQVRGLMEMQRNLMLMYTSCGWFFSDVSGIETVQVLAYAARAAELAERYIKGGFERRLLRDLAKAKSNVPEQGDARRIYEQRVLPTRVDARQIAARAGLRLLATGDPPQRIACHDIRTREGVREALGTSTLAAARLTVASRLTGEHADLALALVSTGGAQVSGGVWIDDTTPGSEAGLEPIVGAFTRGEVTAAQEAASSRAAYPVPSLAVLPVDERRLVWKSLADPITSSALTLQKAIVDRHAADMALAATLELEPPEPLAAAVRSVVHAELHALLQRDAWEALDVHLLRAQRLGARVDERWLAAELDRRLSGLASAAAAAPHDVAVLERLRRAAQLSLRLGARPDLFGAQNAIFRSVLPLRTLEAAKAKEGDAAAVAWLAAADQLLDALGLAPLP